MTQTPSPGNLLAARMAFIGQILNDKKASDVLALDVSSYSGAFEGIVLASAHGRRHCKALADALLERIRKDSIEFLGMEGYQEGEWILLDLNDVIVHIFTRETRIFYNLEGFWAKGKTVNILPDGDNNG